jgi:hypothetical protein
MVINSRQTPPAYSFLRRSVVAVGASAALMLVAAGGASAQEASSDDPVVAALVAAGADADQLTADLTARVNERIDKAIEAGALTEEEIAYVEEIRDSGELEARIAERVETSKAEREARRAAVVERLAEAGVTIAEGQTVRDALIEAGFTKDEAKDLMREIRPERPSKDDDVESERTIAERIDRLIERVVRSDEREERKEEREVEKEERKEERKAEKEERKEERKAEKEERKEERKAEKEERKEERKDEEHVEDKATTTTQPQAPATTQPGTTETTAPVDDSSTTTTAPAEPGSGDATTTTSTTGDI